MRKRKAAPSPDGAAVAVLLARIRELDDTILAHKAVVRSLYEERHSLISELAASWTQARVAGELDLTPSRISQIVTREEEGR